jgi:hypothetical protein
MTFGRDFAFKPYRCGDLKIKEEYNNTPLHSPLSEGGKSGLFMAYLYWLLRLRL